MNMSEFNELHDHLKKCVDSNNESHTAIIKGWELGLLVKKEHDRLTSENARLREALRKLVSRGTTYINLDELCQELDSDDIASIEDNFNQELIKSDQLLTELEKGDE